MLSMFDVKISLFACVAWSKIWPPSMTKEFALNFEKDKWRVRTQQWTGLGRHFTYQNNIHIVNKSESVNHRLCCILCNIQSTIFFHWVWHINNDDHILRTTCWCNVPLKNDWLFKINEGKGVQTKVDILDQNQSMYQELYNHSHLQ